MFTQKGYSGVCSLTVCSPTLIRTNKGRADNTKNFLFVQEQKCPEDDNGRKKDAEFKEIKNCK